MAIDLIKDDPVEVMPVDKYGIEAVSIKYGLYSTVGLIAYFMIMKLVGLAHVYELRTLNFIILVAGIIKAINIYKDNHQPPIGYLKGFAIGIMTSAVAVLPFALFIFIYLQLDAALLGYIKANDSFGQYLNPYVLAFVIAFEGLFSGLIMTFIIMQYKKRAYLKGGGID